MRTIAIMPATVLTSITCHHQINGNANVKTLRSSWSGSGTEITTKRGSELLKAVPGKSTTCSNHAERQEDLEGPHSDRKDNPGAIGMRQMPLASKDLDAFRESGRALIAQERAGWPGLACWQLRGDIRLWLHSLRSR